MSPRNRRPRKANTADVCFNVGEESYVVTVEYDIDNDGIGPYEFWGSRGYDAGHDYPVVTEATAIRPDGWSGPEALTVEAFNALLHKDSDMEERLNEMLTSDLLNDGAPYDEEYDRDDDR